MSYGEKKENNKKKYAHFLFGFRPSLFSLCPSHFLHPYQNPCPIHIFSPFILTFLQITTTQHTHTHTHTPTHTTFTLTFTLPSHSPTHSVFFPLPFPFLFPFTLTLFTQSF